MIPPNQTTTAMDAVESIFETAGFTYLRKKEAKDVITSNVRWDQTGGGQLLVTPGSTGRSILICCSYNFIPPFGCIGKLRKFFQDESLDMRGLSVEFYTRQGVQLTARYWIPSLDLTCQQLIAQIDPYLTEVLFHSVMFFPKLAQLLKGLNRSGSLDDFHLSS